MAKYDGIRNFFNSRDVFNTPPTIREIENYLGLRLPRSYYDKSYWNNSKCAIGKILNEMGIKVKSVKTVIEFEEINGNVNQNENN